MNMVRKGTTIYLMNKENTTTRRGTGVPLPPIEHKSVYSTISLLYFNLHIHNH
jgi:hypothetical protein